MDIFYTNQFQNIPINVVCYNEQICGDVCTDAYNITVNCPANRESSQGSFILWIGSSKKIGVSTYVGNRQGGPINEVDNLNDPVLQGEYSGGQHI